MTPDLKLAAIRAKINQLAAEISKSTGLSSYGVTACLYDRIQIQKKYRFIPGKFEAVLLWGGRKRTQAIKGKNTYEARALAKYELVVDMLTERKEQFYDDLIDTMRVEEYENIYEIPSYVAYVLSAPFELSTENVTVIKGWQFKMVTTQGVFRRYVTCDRSVADAIWKELEEKGIRVVWDLKK